MWSIDSRQDELLVDIVRTALLLLLTYSPAVFNFDVIVPLIKSFYLIQGHVK